MKSKWETIFYLSEKSQSLKTIKILKDYFTLEGIILQQQYKVIQMEDKKVQELADTLKERGLAASMADAIEKAKNIM